MKKFIKIIWHLSFKNKVLISYFIIILIPISVSGIYVYRNAVTSIKEKTYTLIEQQLDQQKNIIENHIHEFEKIVDNISMNKTLNDYLNGYYPNNSDLILYVNNNITPLFIWLLNTNPSINYIQYYTNNQIISSYYLFNLSSKLENKTWFKKVSKGISENKYYWETNHIAHRFIDTKKIDNVYSLFSSISPSLDNKYNTCVEIEIKTDYLFKNIQNASIDKNGILFACDKNGILLSESKNSHLNINKKILTNIIQKTPQQLTIANTEYHINIAYIDKINSYLISLIPIDEISSELTQSRNIFLFVILGGLATLYLLSYLLTVFLLKRLKKIIKAVHKIQDDNYDIHIPIEGTDEIDELANNINIMANKINDLINKVYKANIAQKEAELATLHNQINPHFIYNTLETIKMMAEIKSEDEISDCLTSLGNLMRYNISIKKNLVTLEEEIINLQDYIKIQNLMVNNRLKINYSLNIDIKKYNIPNLIFQPIIENCITHGLKNNNTDLLINIIAEKNNNNLNIYIIDNGKGIDDKKLIKLNTVFNTWNISTNIKSSKGNGIALTNINKRIKLRFGNFFGLKLYHSKPNGLSIKIKLPLIAKKKEEI